MFTKRKFTAACLKRFVLVDNINVSVAVLFVIAVMRSFHFDVFVMV